MAAPKVERRDQGWFGDLLAGIGRRVTNLERRVTLTETYAGTGPETITPAWAPGWTGYSGYPAPLAVRDTATGLVTVWAMAARATEDTDRAWPVLLLPDGWKPSGSYSAAGIAQPDSAGERACRWTVNSAGEIWVILPAATTWPAANYWAALNLTFPTS